MTTSCIYALKDPRTDEIHYIGQSYNPAQRLKEHLADTSDSPKVRWLNELSEARLEPRMQVIEAGLTALEANESENWWISEGVEEGWPLTNLINSKSRKPSDFSEWLTNRVERHGWSFNELARRSGISSAMISLVVTGQRNPGIDFCNGVAVAFNFPLEFIFRKAGILPPLPDDDTLTRLAETARILAPTDRDTLLRIAQALAQREPQEAL